MDLLSVKKPLHLPETEIEFEQFEQFERAGVERLERLGKLAETNGTLPSRARTQSRVEKRKPTSCANLAARGNG